MTIILGIKTEDRENSAKKIQNILTKYGCYIKTRLGLHDISGEKCPHYGLILLEIPFKEHSVLIEKKLFDIDGIEIQRMEFNL